MKTFNYLLLSSILLFVACGTTEDSTEVENSLEAKIKNKLNTITTDTDFTLLVKSEEKIFEHSVGKEDKTTLYRSASTSKWITATVILSLVKDGVLSLDDTPQTYIPFWERSGNLSKITLRHLLNFTSGLTEEPFCISLGTYDFESCVEKIANKNLSSKTSGTEFHYGANHLQVAGLMVIKATGKDSWQEVFDSFKQKTNLFSTAKYDLPSLSNPRLAGGMHWSAEEYLAFLEALYKEEILTPELIKLMTSDQLETATIGNSPAILGFNEDWHYGFGTWVECHNTTYTCTQRSKVSSPGIYGAYPFIDYENKYYGIVAREGKLGSFTEGYKILEIVSTDLESWAKE